jgi:hypothetical protein
MGRDTYSSSIVPSALSTTCVLALSQISASISSAVLTAKVCGTRVEFGVEIGRQSVEFGCQSAYLALFAGTLTNGERDGVKGFFS